MFKAPFSFDGRIRRIEYFLSGIIGGIVSSIAWALGVGTFVLGAASGSAGGSVFGLLIGLAAMIASIWQILHIVRQEVQHQFLYLPFVPFIIGFQFHLQAG